MNVSPKKRRDFLQNIAIVLLSLSAALLLIQSQVDTLKADGVDYLNRFLGDAQSALPGITAPAELRELSVPLRVRVAGEDRSSGSLGLTTTSKEFAPLRSLLGEALGSADAYSVYENAAFRDALNQPSVYFDFLNPLPLSYLSGLVGADGAGDSWNARQIVIFLQEDAVLLAFSDGMDTCRISRTAVSREAFQDARKDFQGDDVFFPYERAVQDHSLSALSPCTLLPVQLPHLPILTAQNPMASLDSILSVLGLNPHTNNRYQESSGTEVIVEGNASVRISPDGQISYESGGDSGLQIYSSRSLPSLEEAVIRGKTLLEDLSGYEDNAADFCLSSFRQTEHTTLLRFEYHLNGVPLRFADGLCAAEIQLDGPVVSSLRLHLRQYHSGKEFSLLLPLRQAAAIASRSPEAALFLGYADRGEGSVSASWMLE